MKEKAFTLDRGKRYLLYPDDRHFGLVPFHAVFGADERSQKCLPVPLFIPVPLSGRNLTELPRKLLFPENTKFLPVKQWSSSHSFRTLSRKRTSPSVLPAGCKRLY